MAQKRRFIDVWIVETNTVYREVPYTVVTDWVQQGRLLGDDRVRPSGTAEWYPIGASPTFAAYMPKMEAHRAEDQAEALEPVQLDFTWSRRPEDEDEDVDMIPLIDISLVLLIFFMMTASVSGGLFEIDTPAARNKNVVLSEDMKLWVAIDVKEKKGAAVNKNLPWYSLGLGNDLLVKPTSNLNQFVQQSKRPLSAVLLKLAGPGKGGRPASKVTVMVRLRADQSLPIEVIKRLSVRLRGLEKELSAKEIGAVKLVILGEVKERQAG
jgi:biopolymer transport protein ExbD